MNREPNGCRIVVAGLALCWWQSRGFGQCRDEFATPGTEIELVRPVVATLGHRGPVLGTTANGSFRIRQHKQGLYCELALPDSPLGRKALCQLRKSVDAFGNARQVYPGDNPGCLGGWSCRGHMKFKDTPAGREVTYLRLREVALVESGAWATTLNLRYERK